MYTTIEKAQTNTPTFPDVLKAKKNIAGMTHRITAAVMGREFMELPIRSKVYTLYFFFSFMLLFAWSEPHPWLNVLNMFNFANAGRLANKALKRTSARN